ncbi:hypothetical protein BCD48_30825 [Pseudofrankia sp. BMG5.36]|nr:hypothetical protein BCD48_30825 [Pseudofrankia sp. BMG5.36]
MWIAWTLEAAGYRVHVEAWDAMAGSHSVELLSEAIKRSVRTVVVLSASYLGAARVQAQWQATWEADPQGLRRSLIPVRVEEIEPEGLLRGIKYIDLVGLTDDAARGRLVSEVEASLLGRRGRPTSAPPFPGIR